jgi:hypothetical protein
MPREATRDGTPTATRSFVTSMANGAVSKIRPSASETRTTRSLLTPSLVGVPAMKPSPVFRDSPDGSVPAVRAKP